MRRVGTIVASLALAAIAVAGCSDNKDAERQDLDFGRGQDEVKVENGEVRQPDSITVWLNADKHPNIVRVCLDGLAFRTVSTGQQTHTSAVERVPEWDAICPPVKAR